MKSFWCALRDLMLPVCCASCGREIGDGASRALCRSCEPSPATDLGPPPAAIAAWHAAIEHDGAGAEWVLRFKYPKRGLSGLDPAAEAVAFALMTALAERVPDARPDLVVPVPLHPRRLRERGFSPPALLARCAARAVGARTAPVLLARLRDTPSQTGLSRGARRRNVANAFAARRTAPARVWLVDDVVTTGSTLAAAARALREARAREVVAVCLAQRPLVG
ncbi:MAG: phosphoribosyltransferase family protein [Myxococcota bacterium]